jgi:hypothetical protein
MVFGMVASFRRWIANRVARQSPPRLPPLLRTTGGNRDRRTSATVLITLTLVPLEAQSLRSHPLCFFIECVNLLIEPSVLRLRCIAAPQFFKRFLNREFEGETV